MVLRAVAGYLRVGDPTWAVRRRMAVGTLLFCMAIIVAALFAPVAVDLAHEVISRAFLAIAAVPTIYSLAAVADDHSKRVTSAAAQGDATGAGGGGGAS